MIEALSNTGFQMLHLRTIWGAFKNPDALDTPVSIKSESAGVEAEHQGFLKLPRNSSCAKMCSQIWEPML